MNVVDSKSSDEAALWQWVADYAQRYRASLAERPVAARADSQAIAQRLSELERLPQHGVAPLECIQELVALAEPGITAMSGPRFAGWVVGGTLPAALAADWLTATWDQNAGVGEGAPAATAFENAALSWVVKLLELPEATNGALVTGAMSANFCCLAAARGALLEAAGWDVQQRGLFGAPALRVLVGHERHETIDKAVRLLGLGKQALTCLEVDGQGRLRPSVLARELEQCEGPVIVCAQAGNVNSGAFDALAEIAESVNQYRARRGSDSAWLHVDGAFGLWARAAVTRAPELASLAQGAEQADSWATDAHKVLNVPYDSGIALCREPRALRRAMEIGGAYLDSGQQRTTFQPGMLSPELSRRARGFALWAALRQLGANGVSELVARYAENARSFAQLIEGRAELRVLNQVCFNQVVVQAKAVSGSEPAAWTSRIVRAVQAEGTCYATPSFWHGRPVIRFSFCNAATTSLDVQRMADALVRVVGEASDR
ncbi:MAG TPA: pyridoxal-dependent decarboxylase [Polyangiaceae bacterium]|nr:pyridoxal-dependent decarboxylase [Polyangiaceae bacterium]